MKDKKKETQEMTEKENRKKKMKAHYHSAVLQSHPVGETAACSGYITETTLKMIKYVWNLEFIAMTALL